MNRPGMSDARCFTTYIPSSQLNINIQNRNQIDSSNAYRMFLQNNGNKLMQDFGKICASNENKICSDACQPYSKS